MGEYKWEFRYGPYGSAYQLLAIDTEESIIAHWGLLPHYLRVGKELLKSGKQENAMCDTKYRGKGIYLNFQKKCIKMAWDEGYEVAWTSLSPAAQVHRKAGFQSLGEMTNVIWLINNNILVTFYRFLACAFSILFSYRKLIFILKNLHQALKLHKNKIRRSHKVYFSLVSFDETQIRDFIKIWKQQRQHKPNLYSVTLERDYSYIIWRFFDNPYVSYNWNTIIDKNGIPCGYVVWHRLMTTVYLDDLIFLNKYFTTESIQNVLTCLSKIREFRKGLIVKFLTLRPSPIFNMLIGSGFSYKSRGTNNLKTHLQIYVSPQLDFETANTLSKPEKWYVSRIFSEGLS